MTKVYENNEKSAQERSLILEKRIQKYENQFYMQEQRLLKVEKVSESIAEAV